MLKRFRHEDKMEIRLHLKKPLIVKFIKDAINKRTSVKSHAENVIEDHIKKLSGKK